MQMRDWRRWARVVVLTVLGLTALRPVGARGDGDPEPPQNGEHMRKIGPQAVVIVNEQGKPRMYDDPAEQARACKSTASCWGKALGALGLLGIMTYEDLTQAIDVAGQSASAQPVGPPTE